MSTLASLRYCSILGFIILFFTDNIQDKWHPEVTHYSKAPLLLVGTKSDLRDDKDVVATLARRKREPVTYAQGVAMAKSV